MPVISANTDFATSKPKFSFERQSRDVKQLTTANITNSGATTITLSYNDGAQNNVANTGIAIGQFVYSAGLSANGIDGFFKSNNTVTAISGNNVTVAAATFASIPAGSVISFDTVITYGIVPSKANSQYNTYNADTILITPTRNANNGTAQGAIANVGNFSVGWVHIQKKVNNDGTVRYLKETLQCVHNGVTSNTSSGNTSFGQVVQGL
jgi:hypothetical protein